MLCGDRSFFPAAKTAKESVVSEIKNGNLCLTH